MTLAQKSLVSVLLLRVIFSIPAVEARESRHYKVDFNYFVSPNSLQLHTEDAVLQLCLVNLDKSKELQYHTRRHDDRITITIPIGMDSHDLVENASGIECTSMSTEWACEIEEINQEELILVIHPEESVFIDSNQSVCFYIEGLDINPVEGVAFLQIKELFHKNNKRLSSSAQIRILKSLVSSETDPTVPEDLKDGVSWQELISIPGGFADGSDDGITSEEDPTVPASIKDGIAWNEVAHIPNDIADGDDVGLLIETDPNVPDEIKDGISWQEVDGRPAGLDDGDDNTWLANTKNDAGYVAAGGTNANKVWKTDEDGNPGWRTDEMGNCHDRYTDEEAFAAAKGVDAGTLDGLDSTDFAIASHTHSLDKVAIVAQSGGDYTDPIAAMDDIDEWCGIPNETNPCLVKIMPGIYTLGNNALIMQPYVDIAGSGENTTTITSTHSGDSLVDSATVLGADNAEIRFLTIENQGGAAHAIGLYNSFTSPKITNVTVVVSGGAASNRGVQNISSTAVLTNVIVKVSGSASSNRGVYNHASFTIMTNIRIMATGGIENWGVFNNVSASPTMNDVTVTASGGDINYGVFNNESSSPDMTNVTATAHGGNVINFGVVNQASSSAVMRNCSISGKELSVHNNQNSTAKIAGTLLNGSISGDGFSCIGSYNDSFIALGTNCR